MGIDRKFKKIIKTIYPRGMDEYTTASDIDEKLLEKLMIVLKYIKKPSKYPINLLNQIIEKKKEMIISLEERLSTKEVITFFKGEVPNITKEYSEEIKLIKECEKLEYITRIKEEIHIYIKKIENIKNPFDLVQLKIDLDEIIPYEIKSLQIYNYTEQERLGWFAIQSCPLLIFRENIIEKNKDMISKIFHKFSSNDEIKNEYSDIRKLYEDIFTLNEISEMMLSYISRYTQPKKGIFSWSRLFGVLIIGYMALEVFNIIERNNTIIITLATLYIIFGGLKE